MSSDSTADRGDTDPDIPEGASAAETVAELVRRFDDEASRVDDREAWDALRIRWVGRKGGLVRELLSRTGQIPKDERPEYGKSVNRLKNLVEDRLESLEEELEAREAAAAARAARVDVTLPGRRPRLGNQHPVTLVSRHIVEIFQGLGYSVAEGPEVEDDFHNFEALNMPEGHPARDEQDTFFVEGGDLLLRTHTSPVQIRTMLSRTPPIRVVCPGRVFRRDNSLRHSPMFHQIECLAVDRGITFADLKGTLQAFLTRLFSPETEVRLRPSFFPFTEPSAEVDVTCQICGGSGCATCSQSGWMEILGAGMVDPRVLRACDVDPSVYSGFAFGLGLDRVAMNRYDIPNIRTLFDNDERLLRQIEE